MPVTPPAAHGASERRRCEVDDAECSDGKTYDLKFDAGFGLTEKKPED